MKNFTSILFLFISAFTFSQKTSVDYQSEFSSLLKENNKKELQRVVGDWKHNLPNDPEGYVAIFNYYLILAQQSELIAEDSLSFGFDQNQADIDADIYIDSALIVIEEAIMKFPSRLDMRLGYIHILGSNNHWQLFTNNILEVLTISKLNDFKKWKWSNDQIVGDEARNFVFESVLDYQSMLFNSYDNELLDNMLIISQKTLELDPLNYESLNINYLVYNHKGLHNEALECITKAVLLQPEDRTLCDNYLDALSILYPHKKVRKIVKEWAKSKDPAKNKVATYLMK